MTSVGGKPSIHFHSSSTDAVDRKQESGNNNANLKLSDEVLSKLKEMVKQGKEIPQKFKVNGLTVRARVVPPSIFFGVFDKTKEIIGDFQTAMPCIRVTFTNGSEEPTISDVAFMKKTRPKRAPVAPPAPRPYHTPGQVIN